MRVSKHLVLYSPSIWALQGKPFLYNKFADFRVGALKSQIKAIDTSVRVSKDSPPCNPSISTLNGKSLVELLFYLLANRCRKMTDQGLKDLSRGLKNLSAIQSINLGFKG